MTMAIDETLASRVRKVFGGKAVAAEEMRMRVSEAVAAKHHMASVSGYLLIETAFVFVHYAVVSPLIALVYAKSPRTAS
jgi:hypothetical protein